MTLLLFSFAAGLATILAPCIWPLLPIVLSASSGEGRRRPIGFILGLMTSFLILTLAVSYLEKSLGLDPNAFRTAAVAIIALLGLSMIFPALGARFEVWISKLVAPFQRSQGQGEGFFAGYASGFSVGLLWAPCAGPILATVATLAATRAVNIRVVAVTAAYAIGVGIPLFFIATGSATLFAKLRRFNRLTGRVQQVFGLIMIGAATLIYTNYDKTLQLRVLNAFPSYGRFFTGLEDNSQVSGQLDQLRGRKASAESDEAGLKDLGSAPDFAGIAHWLNSSPLSMAQLRGKVVLVDFWTYSCINCLRTLPYLRQWNSAYGPSGLVIVGVHSPEFAFEKKTENVESAIRQFGIQYPVAQDNDFATWNAYQNSYWPAEYLIDATGHIRLEHFGEGHYDEMDAAIRRLLAEAGRPVMNTARLPREDGSDDEITPETYLGRNRMERFASAKPSLGEHRFSAPKSLARDHFAYQGRWKIGDESATAIQDAALELRFSASHVYLVIGPGKPGDSVGVFLDGKPIPAGSSGADVRNARVSLDRQRLYDLVDLKGGPSEHRLRLRFDAGVSVYAFTFG